LRTARKSSSQSMLSNEDTTDYPPPRRSGFDRRHT
jgi:hypothetical protein